MIITLMMNEKPNKWLWHIIVITELKKKLVNRVQLFFEILPWKFVSMIYPSTSLHQVRKEENFHSSKLSQNNFFKNLGFTPCKAEQPLLELQEKEAQKD